MWTISFDADTRRVTGVYPPDYAGITPAEHVITVNDQQRDDLCVMLRSQDVYVTDAGAFETRPEPEPTLDEHKAAKRAEIAAARYEAETGGIEVDGVTIATDRGSQALLTAAVVSARLDPEFKTRWKCADGHFVALDAFQLRAIGDAVIAHVEACFAREGELCEQIDAAQTPEELDAIQWSL